MQTLIDKAFARLENRNSQASTFLLAQAMGGGKTHSMIALGLLAKYPALRRKILGDTATVMTSSAKSASKPNRI
jgi:predicted AAA+ superfamily ATPase